MPCICPPAVIAAAAAGFAGTLFDDDEAGFVTLSVVDCGSEEKPLVLDHVGVRGEPAAPLPCLSATGDVGVKSEPEPWESLVRFFLRKPRLGIELELLRFRGLGMELGLEELAE